MVWFDRRKRLEGDGHGDGHFLGAEILNLSVPLSVGVGRDLAAHSPSGYKSFRGFRRQPHPGMVELV